VDLCNLYLGRKLRAFTAEHAGERRENLFAFSIFFHGTCIRGKCARFATWREMVVEICAREDAKHEKKTPLFYREIFWHRTIFHYNVGRCTIDQEPVRLVINYFITPTIQKFTKSALSSRKRTFV
jgi:hypothetical protein